MYIYIYIYTIIIKTLLLQQYLGQTIIYYYNGADEKKTVQYAICTQTILY